jgi:hypothetical protein
MKLDNKFIDENFNTVLILDDLTANKTRGLFKCKKLLVIGKSSLDNQKCFYGNKHYNVTHYGEMPFHYKDCHYKMKMLFDRYKELPYTLPDICIHSPNNLDTSFVKKLLLPPKVITFREQEYKTNFLCDFDLFLYYHADKYFDLHPRLMHECYFYGKGVLYFNRFNLKDGSYYRYNDLMGNGLINRFLSKDDEIIRQLI